MQIFRDDDGDPVEKRFEILEKKKSEMKFLCLSID